MEITGDCLDEVMMDLYEVLLSSADESTGSRGSMSELLGTAVRLRRPRARLSRSESRGKPFSALAELLWYLAGSDKLDFIRPYIPAYEEEAIGGIIPGAYGPRIFKMRGVIDQLDSVARLLRYNSTSKRAVVQIFNAEDIALPYPEGDDPSFVYPEVPCTVGLQFHLREGRLHATAFMRSNDAFKGLPHDVFCFTMIQEMMARKLGVELGEYLHYAGSMHIYDKNLGDVRRYMEEGHQRIAEMPPMPAVGPFERGAELLLAEERIRAGEPFSANLIKEPYWADLVRLIQVFWASGDAHRLDDLKSEFDHAEYKIFAEARKGMARRGPEPRRPASAGSNV